MDFKELVKVGAHFGHVKSRLNPRMRPYIWGIKNNVHLIDVSKTAVLVDQAAKFLESVAAQGKPILWIGTKKAAKDVITTMAQKLEMPYVSHRWIGGTLSNFSQVKKSVTKLLHYEDILTKSDKYPHYTKKELNVFGKVVERLKRNIGGIRSLKWPIGAVVLVDVAKEMSALKEAATVGIPVVAIVDTNGDPSLVDYVIPSNDDSVRPIKLIIETLADSVQKGQKALKQAKAGAAEEKAKAKELKEKAAEKPKKKVEAAKKPAVKKTPEKKTETKAAPIKKEAEAKPVVKEPKKTVAKKEVPKTVKESAKEPKKTEKKVKQ